MAGRKDGVRLLGMEGLETGTQSDFKDCGVLTLVVGPLDVNCYVVWDKETMDACVIDPGGDAEAIEGEIGKRGLNLKYVINTHGHFDHTGANRELASKFKAVLAIHPGDKYLLESADYQSSFFGYSSDTLTRSQPKPKVEFKDAMELRVGRVILKILHTPGHTPGSVSIHIEKAALVFTGDTLFSGSVGRTDLEGGSQDDLINSIREKLLPLGDDTVVLPGHGPETTIGKEKFSNPFIAGL